MSVDATIDVDTSTEDENVPEDERIQFGLALREAIRFRQTSQSAIARHLGTTQSVVSQWCTGQYICPPATVFAIEEHLALLPGHLSKHYGYYPPEAVLQHPRIDIDSVIMSAPGLSDTDKYAILNMVQHLQSYHQQQDEKKSVGARRIRSVPVK